MNKRTRVFVLTAVCMLAFAASAMAGTPGINTRQAHQRARIAQGIHSGALTRAEAMRLVVGQRQIQRQERRAKADGVVTAAERARLHRSLDRESRAIARKKHNARSR